MKIPTAPKHLSGASKAIWRAIYRDYQIDSAAEMVLACTLEARDRREQAREQLAAEGCTQADRFGQKKPHPSTAIERTRQQP